MNDTSKQESQNNHNALQNDDHPSEMYTKKSKLSFGKITF